MSFYSFLKKKKDQQAARSWGGSPTFPPAGFMSPIRHEEYGPRKPSSYWPNSSLKETFEVLLVKPEYFPEKPDEQGRSRIAKTLFLEPGDLDKKRDDWGNYESVKESYANFVYPAMQHLARSKSFLDKLIDICYSTRYFSKDDFDVNTMEGLLSVLEEDHVPEHKKFSICINNKECCKYDSTERRLSWDPSVKVAFIDKRRFLNKNVAMASPATALMHEFLHLHDHIYNASAFRHETPSRKYETSREKRIFEAQRKISKELGEPLVYSHTGLKFKANDITDYSLPSEEEIEDMEKQSKAGREETENPTPHVRQIHSVMR